MDPFFLKTVTLDQNFPISTKLKLTVCDVKNRSKNQVISVTFYPHFLEFDSVYFISITSLHYLFSYLSIIFLVYFLTIALLISVVYSAVSDRQNIF